jgi:homoaconitase/3-isopropylmalate dehydratase large subunit
MGAGRGATGARCSPTRARTSTPWSTLDATQIPPQVTWGTSPEMVVDINGRVPDPDKEKDASKRGAIERALVYMGWSPTRR